MKEQTAHRLIASLRAIQWIDRPEPTIENYRRAPFCLTEQGLRLHLSSDAFSRAIAQLVSGMLAEIMERRPRFGGLPWDVVASEILAAISHDRRVAAAIASAASREARDESRRRRAAQARELRAQGLTYAEIGERIAELEDRRADKLDPDSFVVPYSRDAVRRWLRDSDAE
jgi:hypothetical protein